MPLTTQKFREGNLREVVLAIQRLLIRELADIFTEGTILITDPDEWEAGESPENLINTSFVTLAPGDATFNEELQYGGGIQTVEEDNLFNVYVFSDSRLDQTGVFPAAIYDENEGLLELKRRVLKALVMADPTGDNQLPLLSQGVYITSSSRPRKNTSGVHFIQLAFKVSFHWDLSG
jgi:hypothetical protein